jgi:hypothetical protein
VTSGATDNLTEQKAEGQLWAILWQKRGNRTNKIGLRKSLLRQGIPFLASANKKTA